MIEKDLIPFAAFFEKLAEIVARLKVEKRQKLRPLQLARR